MASEELPPSRPTLDDLSADHQKVKLLSIDIIDCPNSRFPSGKVLKNRIKQAQETAWEAGRRRSCTFCSWCSSPRYPAEPTPGW